MLDVATRRRRLKAVVAMAPKGSLRRSILAIGRQAHRIRLSNLDACEFIRRGGKTWPEKTLVYLDPPYFVKGRRLYHDFYRPEDHAEVADAVRRELKKQSWIVSYDDVPEIRDIYGAVRTIAPARLSFGYEAKELTGPSMPFATSADHLFWRAAACLQRLRRLFRPNGALFCPITGNASCRAQK